MIVSGHVENNKIILDDKINLPHGAKVKVIIQSKNKTKSSGLCGIWNDERTTEEIVNEIIKSRTFGREVNL